MRNRKNFYKSERKLGDTASLASPPVEKPTGGRREHAFTLTELLVTIAVIATLAGLLLPVATRAKRQTNSVHCRSNLRQTGFALRLYADDREGRLPSIGEADLANNPTAPQLRNVISGLPNETFRCREDKTGRFQQTGSSYDWNSALNGRLLHRIGADSGASDGPNQAMVFDHEAWHGYKNAVFADGHAARLQ
jgi:prepilin-type N-terminal cleavage/methylation domain-containing protein/prepilin-type processing-associated H-X9-DG protein